MRLVLDEIVSRYFIGEIVTGAQSNDLCFDLDKLALIDSVRLSQLQGIPERLETATSGHSLSSV